MENGELSTNPKYKGIGGWLILVIIGLIITLFISSIHIYYQTVHLLPKYWPGSNEYHPLWGTYVIFILVYEILLVLVPVILLVLMFRKSRLFPKAMIFFLISETVLDLISAVLVLIIYTNVDGYTFIRFVFLIVTALIWVPYFLVSKRVKATFLNVNFENKEAATTDTTLHH
ncbi:DUF2569 domain-containing protein [Neobacillus sp. CF12]|uniref:DUF2569 domain-containing protein n=1 Tax=Neobacillus sp. CF12 TaxID=3055864 RepID=UPI0025A18619|nr:DUF2569 domain-containing protein [Neobacillus sp. CF12]MDM5326925.1 DUF2569 domain-containing protein [Neobacillus sp. CF12]